MYREHKRKKKKRERALKRAHREEEKKLQADNLREQFDLTMGILYKGRKMFKNNYRPLIYTLTNVTLMIVSLFVIWLAYVAVAINFLVLGAALYSQCGFNVLETCGPHIRRWFKFKRDSHFTVMDAWFKIEERRNRHTGLPMVSQKPLDISTDKQLRFAIGTLSPSRIAKAPPILEKKSTLTRLTDSLQRKKQHKQLANNKIIPKHFTFGLVGGWLFLHILLLASNDSPFRGAPGSWYDHCKYDEGSDKKNGTCLVRYSCILAMVSFTIFSVFCSFVLIPNVRTNALALVNVAQRGLLKKFPGNATWHTPTVDTDKRPGAAPIIKRIEATLLKVKPMNAYFCCPYVTAARFNVAFSIALMVVPLMSVHSGYVSNLNKDKLWKLLIFLPSISGAIYCAVLIFQVMWRVHHFYAMGCETMRVLGEALHVSCIEDLMVWWETRKFFLVYRLPVNYIYGSSALVFMAFMSVTSLGYIAIQIVIAPNHAGVVFKWAGHSPLNITMIILVVVFCAALVKILLKVEDVVNAQQRHFAMLRHELVRLDSYGALFARRIQDVATKRQKEAIEKAATRRKLHCSPILSSASMPGRFSAPSLLSAAGIDQLSADELINAFGDVGSATLWMDDMKVEKQMAAVGKDAHDLILSMLHIIENNDEYPKILGLSVKSLRVVIWSIISMLTVISVKMGVVFDWE